MNLIDGCGAATGPPGFAGVGDRRRRLAVDLACALHAYGIRGGSDAAHAACAGCTGAMRKELPDLLIGAGTVIHAEQFNRAREAGAQFAVSPGCTERLAAAAEDSGLPYLPGVMASEVLLALEYVIARFSYSRPTAPPALKCSRASKAVHRYSVLPNRGLPSQITYWAFCGRSMWLFASAVPWIAPSNLARPCLGPNHPVGR